MSHGRRWGSILLLASCCSCGRSPAPASLPGPGPKNKDEIVFKAPERWFRNVAGDAGVTAVLYCGGIAKDHILESVGSGVALIDFDKDGQLDLYCVNAWALDEEPSQVRRKGRNVLYRNVGQGRFEDVTDQAGVGDESWGCGVCAGDFDNDGHVDLYVTNFGPNRLYRNRGNGTFEEIGEAAGVADPGWGAGACFFDADRDGDLDLYVVNYIECRFEEVLSAQRTHVWQDKIRVMSGPFGMRGGKDRYFRNEGGGRFRDATDEAGLTDVAESYGLGVLASDLDNDGDVDLYVANDSNPNFLYRNDGTGQFRDVGSWTGAAVSADGAAQGSMGVDAGDLDGDGLQELFVTNFARDYSTLYRNAGELFFEDVTAKWQLQRATFLPMGWGTAFFDVDLDKDLDLIQLNGHIYPQVDEVAELGETYRQVPLLLRNHQSHLEEVSESAFSTDEVRRSARGLAVGDYDNDGDLDLAVTAIDSPVLLLRNDAPREGHWLKLRLLNKYGAPAVGARARITIDGAAQMRELRSGSTYQSQSALELHFGLGGRAAPVDVEITWPDGAVSNHSGVAVDQTTDVRQP
jgi:hypothetical protein